MSAQVQPVYLSPAVQAKALGEALAQLGFTTEVLAKRSHQQHPCVVVTSGPKRAVASAEYVYAGPDDAGRWWFWLSNSQEDPLDLDPVTPVSEVSSAADHVARALAGTRAVRSLRAS